MPLRFRMLLIIGLINLAGGIAIAMVSSFAAGLSSTVIMSRYREMESRGVIQHDRLADVLGPEYVHNWALVVDWLIGESLTGLYRAGLGVAFVVGLNGLGLIFLWVHYRRAAADGPS